MTNYVAAAFLVLGFIWILKIFKVVEKASHVIDISKRAFSDIVDAELDDLAKEKAMQAHAKTLFSLFFTITLGGFLALIGPYAALWFLDRQQILSLDDVMALVLSWQFLVGSTLIIIALLFAVRSIRK